MLRAGSSLRMTPGTITAHLAHLQHGSHISGTPSKLSWWGSVDLLAGKQGGVAAMRSIEGLASPFVARVTKARKASGY